MPTAAPSTRVLSFEDAYAVVQQRCQEILSSFQRSASTEEIPLAQAQGRVLAEPILADRDFPPFPRATRDGFAVRSQDLLSLQKKDLQKDAQQSGTSTLRIVGQVRAGDSYDLPVSSGEAVEIMTGAAVPAGADAVVMVEYTERRTVEIEPAIGKKPDHKGRVASRSESAPSERANADDQILDIPGDTPQSPEPPTSSQRTLDQRTEEIVIIQRPAAASENIVPAGAEAHAGQELLPRGTRLGPAQIAMAAAAGAVRVKVHCRPRIAILSTGDELVDLIEKPGASQIRNSNSYSLAALVALYGGEPVQLPIAPDEEHRLTELVQEGLKAEMLLLSGGVSMGKFDLVEQVLKNLGAQFFFTGALIQPGKPVVFGQLGNVPFFGHPGNPVSVMVTFELFARPVLEALSGAEPSRLKSAKAALKTEFKTKTGLTRFLPAALTGGLNDPQVETIPWQGSGDMLAAARANCYLVVPPDRDRLEAGEMVTVLLR